MMFLFAEVFNVIRWVLFKYVRRTYFVRGVYFFSIIWLYRGVRSFRDGEDGFKCLFLSYSFFLILYGFYFY